MKTIIFLFGLLILSFSCSQDNDGIDLDKNKPYYKFEDSDYEMMPILKKGRLITYKNQFNETLHFKVKTSKIEKVEVHDGIFWGSFSWLVYYQDRQVIELELLEYPDLDEKIEYITIKLADGIKGGVYFPMFNDNLSPIYILGPNIAVDYTAPPQEIVIGRATYHKVLIFNSTRDYVSDFNYGPFKRNVIKVFYDLNSGIIGFDDLDGKEWRIVN